MIEFALGTRQCTPDRLSRAPMAFLHPAPLLRWTCRALAPRIGRNTCDVDCPGNRCRPLSLPRCERPRWQAQIREARSDRHQVPGNVVAPNPGPTREGDSPFPEFFLVGADIITSNNFWTAPTWLKRCGLGGEWRRYVQAPAENALKARDKLNAAAYVAGGMRPRPCKDRRNQAQCPTSGRWTGRHASGSGRNTPGSWSKLEWI